MNNFVSIYKMYYAVGSKSLAYLSCAHCSTYCNYYGKHRGDE